MIYLPKEFQKKNYWMVFKKLKEKEIVMNTQEDLLKLTGKKEVQTILEEEPEH